MLALCGLRPRIERNDCTFEEEGVVPSRAPPAKRVPPRKYSRIMQHMCKNARIVFGNTASPHEYATHSLLP